MSHGPAPAARSQLPKADRPMGTRAEAALLRLHSRGMPCPRSVDQQGFGETAIAAVCELRMQRLHYTAFNSMFCS